MAHEPGSDAGAWRADAHRRRRAGRVAYIGSLIVDAVVAAMKHPGDSVRHVFELVLLEGAFVASTAAAQRGISLCQSLLRAQLGQRVNVMILEKALTLELQQLRGLGVLRQAHARAARGIEPAAVAHHAHLRACANTHLARELRTLLARFSPWAVAVLLLAGLPAFVAEAKFSGDAFRLFRWRSPETRMQTYLETVLAREDHAKEVKLFGLGRASCSVIGIFSVVCTARIARSPSAATPGDLSGADRNVRTLWRLRVDRLSAARSLISLGQMTMYLLLSARARRRVGESLRGRRHV